MFNTQSLGKVNKEVVNNKDWKNNYNQIEPVKEFCTLKVNWPYIANRNDMNNVSISYEICNSDINPFPNSENKIWVYEHSRKAFSWTINLSGQLSGRQQWLTWTTTWTFEIRWNKIEEIWNISSSQCKIISYIESFETIKRELNYQNLKYQCIEKASDAYKPVTEFLSRIKIGTQRVGSLSRDCLLWACYTHMEVRIKWTISSALWWNHCWDWVINFWWITGTNIGSWSSNGYQILWYQSWEQCDDWNSINWDWCSSSCKAEICLQWWSCSSNTDCYGWVCEQQWYCEWSYINNPWWWWQSCSHLNNQQACDGFQPYQWYCNWIPTPWAVGKCSC